tara:strand:- start:417 stop:680 length:264 start_codon:yes stop_codon:yes gene_type:complete
MKATPKDKKYFFAIRDQIHQKLQDDGVQCTKGTLTDVLKVHANMDGISLVDIDKDSLNELKETTKQFAMRIGLDIDKGNGIEFNWGE